MSKACGVCKGTGIYTSDLEEENPEAAEWGLNRKTLNELREFLQAEPRKASQSDEKE